MHSGTHDSSSFRLKQKRPKGVINFESSSKRICQKPLLASNVVNTLLSPSMAGFALHHFVQWCQVYADPYTPIRFWDTNNTRAPLCGDSNRKNDALWKHRINFVLHFRQQWVRYFPWRVDANWLYIRVELDPILGFQFPQTTEKLKKFSNEIHLFNAGEPNPTLCLVWSVHSIESIGSGS